MKITPAHYSHLLEAIQPFSHLIPSQRAFIIEEGKAKDVEKRLRFDLMYMARLSAWACDNLYPYLNDVHLNTALRQVVAEIEA